ncbi:hypothetical protein BB561_001386 [Smittium simulii]|uniref:RNA polymerase Rpb4/RPC9 core domain-containing protein n=1 Tax=Smittium simulii TaxID=133385 RepID=A0A2T9YUT5_9FUNG|nr:hypothetical protein BB561_001386 [Smittium simulii]
MSYNRRVVEEEDAASLKLGKDFQNVECLLISEVKILLEAQRDSKVKENKALTAIHQKTLDYTKIFSRFTNQDSVREVRKLLSTSELSSFEISQLGNMCCSEAVEAKSLIPSLIGKIDDESLEHLLKQIGSIKKFQT